jgi:hypothetical protein
VATFSTLSINKTGTGYTLTAASGSVTGATSTGFDITPAADHHLAFALQPTNTAAGAAISPAVTVEILDQFNNLTMSSANVTVAIGTNPGGGMLSGTATVAAVGGVATFSTLSIDKVGTGYTLAATSGSLTGSTSSAFNITPAAADHLAFGVQLSNSVAGVAISPSVTVRILDQFNNLVTTSTANVTVAIGTNPGGGTLSGTATVAAVGGIASFSTLSIDKAGTGYTLGATSGNLTGATSSPFNISAAAASKLVWTTQPTNTVVALPIGIVRVQVTDAFGNPTGTMGATVAVAINPTTGTSGAVLSGTLTATTDNTGTANFGDLSINLVGTGYKLTATTVGYASADSSAFDILPGVLLPDVITVDPNFQKIDGFDVLFGKGSTNAVQKLKNTNPATFHYNLTLTNNTGTNIHPKGAPSPDKFVGSASVILTVPGLPSAGVNTPYPGGLGPTDPAFVLQGGHAIHVHPDDKSDDMPVTISYTLSAPGGDCTAVAANGWTAGMPADGLAVKCIKITDFDIPTKGKAKIDVNYEFRFKNTDGWQLNAQQMFRAGFSFKSMSSVTFASNFPIVSLQNQTFSGNQVVGLVGAGDQTTAVGGFVFDKAGNGLPAMTVNLYNTAPTSTSCPSSPVASVVTDNDGFYFAGPLSSGIQYFAVICNGGNITTGRFIDHKLANKEFDEEDFYINPGYTLQFAPPLPGTIKKGTKFAAFQVKVLNASDALVTSDNSTIITLMIGTNPANGNLGGKTAVTVVGGIATFNDLQIDKPGNGYTIIASSNPGTNEISSGPINVTN